MSVWELKEAVDKLSPEERLELAEYLPMVDQKGRSCSNERMQTKVKTKGKRERAKATKFRRFWVRSLNSELDRSGDWLLRNLAKMRAEASPRADSL